MIRMLPTVFLLNSYAAPGSDQEESSSSGLRRQAVERKTENPLKKSKKATNEEASETCRVGQVGAELLGSFTLQPEKCQNLQEPLVLSLEAELVLVRKSAGQSATRSGLCGL